MSDEDEGARPLSADMDLEEWAPQEPPRDFAERVLARVRDESEVEGAPSRVSAPSAPAPQRVRARRWGVGAGVVGALALAAALLLKVGGSTPAHGDAIAKDRVEVAVGDRAKAVLEPGAEIHWNGDDVVQAHGDVFYRVEPGARFRVHTPAGDVEVKGTCFAVKVRGEAASGAGDSKEAVDMNKRDVKSGALGAALSALAFVAVYEGKVAVSHAGERQDLTAGESARVGGSGVVKTGDVGAGQKAFDTKVAENEESSSAESANKNLVAQVSEYRQRLEAIATQKAALEEKLKKSEEKLASADGAAPRNRSEYDLDANDWAELAKTGQIKYRVPCFHSDGWIFSPEKLQNMGLAPQDGAVLKDAYERSFQRVWKEIRPLCIAALGAPPEIIDKIGADSCVHLVYDLASKQNNDATREAHTQVAEIRAGQRPEPPAAQQHVVMKMMLLLTGANAAFEADLAKSFGPEEAHRLAYSDDMCNSNNRWGGGKKRTPPAP
ncbi:MAG: FecR domain-containing protein [Deltaproteobacteria bacterium]|nr:FecR domain-containing protein [Deltaproteobacteria bacterium]